jgi:dolichol-phosphate mannosyltransferase
MIDLSIVLPVRNEQGNLALLLPKLHSVLSGMGATYEIIVVDGNSRDNSLAIAQQYGAIAFVQKEPGYGPALKEGFREACGNYILTLDADLSHEPDFVHKLWFNRDRADVIIASRYCIGGVAFAPWSRRFLSRTLNLFFKWGLALPIKDLSSGFRLYRAEVVKNLSFGSRSFEVLEEILICAYTDGWRVLEIPFTYFPRQHGSSNAQVLRFGLRLLRTFIKMWSLRNSVESVDYDERAFYSRIPLQRYWHRKRHQILMNLARGQGRTLDVGCGSSVTTLSLNFVVGVDIQINKLRFMAQHGLPLVNADASRLPFKNETFGCVLASQLLPFISSTEEVMCELQRVLKPGGLLIIGIPDYSTLGWRVIKCVYELVVPGGYSQRMQQHYTKENLQLLARKFGLIIQETHYVFGSELIIALHKPLPDTRGQNFIKSTAISSPVLTTPLLEQDPQ